MASFPATQVDQGVSLTGRQLMEATRPFATEQRWRSWWSVVSTIIILAASVGIAAIVPWWPLRLVASLLGAMLFVRAFIIYHDFMHGALLRGSRVARVLFNVVGLLLLTPPRYWRYSHNFHHGNVGKPLKVDDDGGLLVTSDLGSFPLMTTEAWRRSSRWTHLHYRVGRHPLTLLLAYVTVFAFSLCLLPWLKEPRKYWDGAVSLIAHGALVAGLWVGLGFWTAFYAFILPFGLAAAMGAYLFYAQHNYEGMRILRPEEWSYYRGATESSSFMKLGAVMNWFTGNIGFHHVHHMNPLIPFYRLPEAMAAVPQLHHAQRTSLWPHDIWSCLRLNLWDSEHRKLVSFRAAKRAA